MDYINWQEEVWAMLFRVVNKWKVGSEEDRHFLALALGGEVGELQNLIKKDWRGDTVPSFTLKIAEEIADIRIYLELIARCYDIDVDMACHHKIESDLRKRWPEPVRTLEEITATQPKSCTDCGYCYMEANDMNFICGHGSAGLMGMYVHHMRKEGGLCGPDADLFIIRNT